MFPHADGKTYCTVVHKCSIAELFTFNVHDYSVFSVRHMNFREGGNAASNGGSRGGKTGKLKNWKAEAPLFFTFSEFQISTAPHHSVTSGYL